MKNSIALTKFKRLSDLEKNLQMYRQLWIQHFHTNNSQARNLCLDCCSVEITKIRQKLGK